MGFNLFRTKDVLLRFSVFILVAVGVFINLKGFAVANGIEQAGDVKYVRLGASISFSGSRRSPSVNGLYGMLAMVDWINDDDNPGIVVNGKRIKFDLEIHDDGSKNDEVERIYNSFTKGMNKVDFLIGPYSSSATEVAVAIAEERGKFLLGPFGASNVIYEDSSQWRVQVVSPADKYFVGHISMLLNEAGASEKTFKTVLAFETDDFSISVHDATKELIETDPNFEIIFDALYPSRGGELTQAGGDMDVYIDGLLNSVNTKSSESDTVVVIGGGHDPDGIAFAQLLNSKGYRPDALALLVAPGISTYFCDVALESEGCTSSYAEGITTVAPWHPPLETFTEGVTNVAVGLDWFGPSHDKSIELMKSKNSGDVPSSYHAGLGGQAILVLANAIIQSQSVKKGKVRDAVKELTFQSCFGNFGVDKDTGKQELQEMLVVQWEKIEDVPDLRVVWPEVQATDSFIFPMPQLQP